MVKFKLLKNVTKGFICFSLLLLIYNYYKIKNTFKALRSKRISDDLKYVLIWDGWEFEYDFLLRGQEVFSKHTCEFSNCYFSKQRSLLNKDYRNYDAILFTGKTTANKYVDRYFKLPLKRDWDQIYIFGMKEDSARNPVCAERFDNFFNLTWTYKLDSDVIWPFFRVIERDGGKVVSPNINVDWKTETKEYEMLSEIEEKVLNKRNYGAWISSVCQTPSRREDIVRQIGAESILNGYSIDVFGHCGSYTCDEDERTCLKVLNSYSFYMAFESVLAEDYVTDNIVNAIHKLCLPVVYGGADYSRFLPPKSYIDATKLGPNETAKLMIHLMNDAAKQLSYYNWLTTYRIEKDKGASVCDLCAALNRFERKVHTNFRKWWNPDYEQKCNRTRQIR